MSLITRRTFLVLDACEEGASMFLAIEAVASIALAHPDWDMNELNTWEEWRKRKEERTA